MPVLREGQALGELELALTLTTAAHTPHVTELQRLVVELDYLQPVVQQVRDYKPQLTLPVLPRGLRHYVAWRIEVLGPMAFLPEEGEGRVVLRAKGLDAVVALVRDEVKPARVVEVQAAGVVHAADLVQLANALAPDLGLALGLCVGGQALVVRRLPDFDGKGPSLYPLRCALRPRGDVQGVAAGRKRRERHLVPPVLHVLHGYIVEGPWLRERGHHRVATLRPAHAVPAAGVDPEVGGVVDLEDAKGGPLGVAPRRVRGGLANDAELRDLLLEVTLAELEANDGVGAEDEGVGVRLLVGILRWRRWACASLYGLELLLQSQDLLPRNLVDLPDELHLALLQRRHALANRSNHLLASSIRAVLDLGDDPPNALTS
mmetsp:Transcript_33902/g.93759  ORF Transcript_33902/g.93759 Transcript_33902/m.93759 type:complete len:375 (-) Transcript_33902:120-1244(-)